ncbi:MAG: hypothetical protein SF029_11980 [bacterium]|nr:hypothetical protein [bacterium]
MAKKVKIVSFIDDREGREDAEIELARLVNEGWEMKTGGGGSGAGLVWGFVVLQLDDDQTTAAES